MKRHFQCAAMIWPWNRQSATHLATEVSFHDHHEHFVLKNIQYVALRSFQISPNTAPATKSDSWTSVTKSDTWISPNIASATKSHIWISANRAITWRSYDLAGLWFDWAVTWLSYDLTKLLLCDLVVMSEVSQPKFPLIRALYLDKISSKYSILCLLWFTEPEDPPDNDSDPHLTRKEIFP